MPVIPATQETEMGVLQFEASPAKILVRPYSKTKLGVVVHACNLSSEEGRGRKIIIQY
jgi:hypothetical protein